MIIGHLAISVLEHHYLDADWVPVMVGGLFPDAVDKTVCQGLHLSAYGRLWGHTVLGLGLTTALVAALRGKRAARSWALGYAGHLIADLESPVPLLYPFTAYNPPPSPSIREALINFIRDPKELLPELLLVIWALWILIASQKRPDRAAETQT